MCIRDRLYIILKPFFIGCGFNLNNKLPTLCLNDMIEELSKQSGRKIEKLSFEKYFALVFTELERLLYLVETGHQDQVIELYYKYWLHGYVFIFVDR